MRTKVKKGGITSLTVISNAAQEIQSQHKVFLHTSAESAPTKTLAYKFQSDNCKTAISGRENHHDFQLHLDNAFVIALGLLVNAEHR